MSLRSFTLHDLIKRNARLYGSNTALVFGDQRVTHAQYAERTARLVAETVKRIPAFETIEKKEFVSQRIGLMGKTGTMQKVASQLCGTTYAPQYIDQFATEPKAESGSDELFGDSAQPQITLVGTSHSGPNYNFGGFLEQHIGADVLNVAFAGGGLEGSMLEYLGSEEFQSNPPKILIWEFSPLYDLASSKIHRQMMAMLDNGCEGKDALLSAPTPDHYLPLIYVLGLQRDDQVTFPVEGFDGGSVSMTASTCCKTLRPSMWRSGVRSSQSSGLVRQCPRPSKASPRPLPSPRSSKDTMRPSRRARLRALLRRIV